MFTCCCKTRDTELLLRAAAPGQRMIRAYMPEQHRLFFEALPWLLVGVLDESGHSMALALTGASGFIHTPTAFTMTIAPHQPLDPGDYPCPHKELSSRSTTEVWHARGAPPSWEVWKSSGRCLPERQLLYSLISSSCEHAGTGQSTFQCRRQHARQRRGMACIFYASNNL